MFRKPNAPILTKHLVIMSILDNFLGGHEAPELLLDSGSNLVTSLIMHLSLSRAVLALFHFVHVAVCSAAAFDSFFMNLLVSALEVYVVFVLQDCDFNSC